MEHDEVSSKDVSTSDLLAAVERVGEQIGELRRSQGEEIADLRDALSEQIESSRTNVREYVRHSAQETVQLVESLMMLLAEAPRLDQPMPATGGFAMDARALLHLAALVEEHEPRNILELGGGTSTIWLGYLTQELGTKIVSVDHLDKYLQKTEAYVRRHNFSDRIECRLAELEELRVGEREYRWYARQAMEDVSEIDLLLIDGPPQSTGKWARYPALPLLREKLGREAIVVLDDHHRKDEQEALAEWLGLYADFVQVDHAVSRLGVIASGVRE